MKTAFWRLAFRPFFLVGAAFSVITIGLWLGYLFGGLPYSGYLAPTVWHAHEMVYGFAVAIIAGFVLTAIRNWTGKPGVSGAKLQFLFAIWASARVLNAIISEPSIPLSALDLLFFPVMAAYLFPYLRIPDMKTERVFFAYFFLFFTGDLLIHLDVLGLLQGFATTGLYLGVHTIILVIIFMGGRVIPFFTESSISKNQPKTYPKIEVLGHVAVWLFLLSQLFFPFTLLSACIAFSAAIFHLIRLQGWYVRRLRRMPLIWVLHLAYLWIVIGFLLSGLATLTLIPPTLAIHSFTVGAVGTIIFGMITRVSLGHTGRPLRASKRAVIGYVGVTLAALVRVFGPLLLPEFTQPMLLGAGVLWMGAFTLFVIEYAPILISPRIDGRDG